MLTTALETGEGPGRRQVTAGQPTSDDLAPSRISFRARTRAPLQSEVSAPGESASCSAPDVHAGKNIESSLPNGYLVLPGTTKTSGLERRPG